MCLLMWTPPFLDGVFEKKNYRMCVQFISINTLALGVALRSCIVTLIPPFDHLSFIPLFPSLSFNMCLFHTSIDTHVSMQKNIMQVGFPGAIQRSRNHRQLGFPVEKAQWAALTLRRESLRWRWSFCEVLLILLGLDALWWGNPCLWRWKGDSKREWEMQGCNLCISVIKMIMD